MMPRSLCPIYSNVAFKVQHDEDLRRLSLSWPVDYSALLQEILHVFALPGTGFRLAYVDHDGDKITLASDADWRLCRAGFVPPPLLAKSSGRNNLEPVDDAIFPTRLLVIAAPANSSSTVHVRAVPRFSASFDWPADKKNLAAQPLSTPRSRSRVNNMAVESACPDSTQPTISLNQQAARAGSQLSTPTQTSPTSTSTSGNNSSTSTMSQVNTQSANKFDPGMIKGCQAYAERKGLVKPLLSFQLESGHQHHPTALVGQDTCHTVTASSSCNTGNIMSTLYVHKTLCDFCDSTIVGVRHKCTFCPDFDLCDKCISLASAHHAHPFRAIEALSYCNSVSESVLHVERKDTPDKVPACVTLSQSSDPHGNMLCHPNIYCDNCETQIYGVRYKCGNCIDFDLCSACEDLSRTTTTSSGIHDPSHVFLKICRPVPTLSILKLAALRQPSNQTKLALEREVSLANKPLLPWSIYHTDSSPFMKSATLSSRNSLKKELAASFVSDITIPNGLKISQDEKFTKKWCVRNTGELSWPDDTLLLHIRGDKLSSHSMGSVAQLPVASGKCAIVTTEQVTPTQTGIYKSIWRLFSASTYGFFGDELCYEVTVVESHLLRSYELLEEPSMSCPTMKSFIRHVINDVDNTSLVTKRNLIDMIISDSSTQIAELTEKKLIELIINDTRFGKDTALTKTQCDQLVINDESQKLFVNQLAELIINDIDSNLSVVAKRRITPLVVKQITNNFSSLNKHRLTKLILNDSKSDDLPVSAKDKLTELLISDTDSDSDIALLTEEKLTNLVINDTDIHVSTLTKRKLARLIIRDIDNNIAPLIKSKLAQLIINDTDSSISELTKRKLIRLVINDIDNNIVPLAKSKLIELVINDTCSSTIMSANRKLNKLINDIGNDTKELTINKLVEFVISDSGKDISPLTKRKLARLIIKDTNNDIAPLTKIQLAKLIISDTSSKVSELTKRKLAKLIISDSGNDIATLTKSKLAELIVNDAGNNVTVLTKSKLAQLVINDTNNNVSPLTKRKLAKLIINDTDNDITPLLKNRLAKLIINDTDNSVPILTKRKLVELIIGDIGKDATVLTKKELAALIIMDTSNNISLLTKDKLIKLVINDTNGDDSLLTKSKLAKLVINDSTSKVPRLTRNRLDELVMSDIDKDTAILTKDQLTSLIISDVEKEVPELTKRKLSKLVIRDTEKDIVTLTEDKLTKLIINDIDLDNDPALTKAQCDQLVINDVDGNGMEKLSWDKLADLVISDTDYNISGLVRRKLAKLVINDWDNHIDMLTKSKLADLIISDTGSSISGLTRLKLVKLVINDCDHDDAMLTKSKLAELVIHDVDSNTMTFAKHKFAALVISDTDSNIPMVTKSKLAQVIIKDTGYEISQPTRRKLAELIINDTGKDVTTLTKCKLARLIISDVNNSLPALTRSKLAALIIGDIPKGFTTMTEDKFTKIIIGDNRNDVSVLTKAELTKLIIDDANNNGPRLTKAQYNLLALNDVSGKRSETGNVYLPFVYDDGYTPLQIELIPTTSSLTNSTRQNTTFDSDHEDHVESVVSVYPMSPNTNDEEEGVDTEAMSSLSERSYDLLDHEDDPTLVNNGNGANQHKKNDDATINHKSTGGDNGNDKTPLLYSDFAITTDETLQESVYAQTLVELQQMGFGGSLMLRELVVQYDGKLESIIDALLAEEMAYEDADQ